MANDQQSTYVLQVSVADLERLRGDARALHVWCALLRYADWENLTCHPSLPTLAADVGVSKETVARALKRLQSLGMVDWENRVSKAGDLDSNEYRLIRQGVGASVPLPPRNGADTGRGNGAGTGGGNGAGTVGAPVTTERIPLERVPTERKRKPARAGVPAELLRLIDGWNALGDAVVKPGNGARRDPPAKAVLSGWQRVQKDPEAREAFRDIDQLLEAIKTASFCHGQGWFSLPWIFNKNKSGEWNAVRILAGAYEQSNGGKHDARNGKGHLAAAGQVHPSDRERWATGEW